MTRLTRRRGFTLIEVMVALAIVAVTLAAGARAAGALTDNADRLQQVMAAQWCADNQLTGLRLARGLPGIGEADFSCEQLGRAAQCRQLIDGVIDGAAAACGFAGQLLVFQSATPEKMPTLLKDIGESFYRWHPKTRPGEGKFEEALVHWLQNACDDAGIPNRIEVVSTGERFDAGRHNTNGRGVEINEVLGWVVVRDNGKVYTKALVGVK